MLIQDLFPEYGRSACRTGNVFISGIPNLGAEGCFEQLLFQTLSERQPVFLFHGQLSAEGRERVLAAARRSGYEIVDVTPYKSEGAPFDLLSLSGTDAERARSVYAFLATKDDSDDAVRTICRFLEDCILALRERGGLFTAEDILRLSVGEVEAALRGSSRLPAGDAAEELSFLSSAGAFACWGSINDRKARLNASGALRLLSGVTGADAYFSGPRLFMVSADCAASDSGRRHACLFNGFLQVAATVCARMNGLGKRYRIFLSGAELLTETAYASALEVGSEGTHPIPLCAYERSAELTMRVHGAHILGYFGHFLIFQNLEGQFWSGFLGTSLMPERTETYGRSRTLPLYLSGVRSGGVVARANPKREALTVRRIEKPLYEARIFAALREKELIHYDVYKNRKTRQKLSW